MRSEDIHIGDVLRVRDWHDMANEFGQYDDDIIGCTSRFISDMRYMCGQTFTVAQREQSCGDYIYTSVEHIEEKDGRNWMISADMLEPFVEDEFDVASNEDFFKLFS